MRSSNTIRKMEKGWSRSNASKYPTFNLTKEGFLALQNKMQNKYLRRATKCRILDFIRFMVSRDFGKPSLDTISMIWMCSRAFLHMFWSALTRELQIEKGKQDWQDESDPQNWHEALQLPKLPWQQKQSSLTMFTGLSYSQLMPTPWPATEQYKNTRDPYKSTHNLQFTISFYCLFSTSLAPNPGARTALICSFPTVTTSQPCKCWLKELSKADGEKGGKVPPRTLRCISVSRFCSHSWRPYAPYVTMASLGTKRYEKRQLQSVKLTWHQKSLPSINFLVLS